ncbi:sensor histidine kinase [Aureibacter tunicatorum]|uniref:histidine kinase n=1 Tax=Aureibacter tunicatorum TaxID=866807 RepID=A0AAE4BR35_9BACT|nr:ATP-binding protein [Aureibacter tunicatorum]MDR6239814.1 signal transduction histidine kinase/ActR/RegA family two-component response regulator [Aureibacter tunicatorum]BDD04289.1 hypothetical protein AUTU_17720 [Aureibacter tunicatorum]
MIVNKTIKILLIDDDEEDFILTKDILDNIPNRRYVLDWIGSYKRGMQAIRYNMHDVYLVDYRLGIHTGIEVIKEAIENGCTKPLILLTGQPDQQIDDQAIMVGAADYLYKGALNEHILDRSLRYSIRHNENLLKISKLNEQLEERVEQRTRELAHAFKKLQRNKENLEKQIDVRREAEKALRQSQRLYQAVARNFPNGVIIVIDREFDFIFADGQEFSRLGVDYHSLMGKNILSIFDEAQKPVVMDSLGHVLRGKNINLEVEFFNSHYQINAVPLQNSLGFVKQIMIVAQNITQQKEAEKEVRNMLAKEKELNELKSRFVAMASHEFRTPLSSILSSASLISKYTTEEQQPKRIKHVRRIKSNVTNLTGILNDFLSISKLEEGKTRVNVEKINITQLSEEIVEEMHVIVKEGQGVKYNHESRNEMFDIDPHILKNIIINLISNAIKYSPEGYTIDFNTNIEDGNLLITVQDYGLGIPENEKEHLFERFFRAANVTNIQGTGLGLNIVKKYVDLLDGEIIFRSKEGEGTTFFLSIPSSKKN